MVYPATFENKIGFDVIKQKLKSGCITSGGRMLVNNMFFTTDFDDVERMLSETEEIRQAIMFHSPFPFNEFSECIDEILRISTNGTVIDPERMPDLKSTMDVFAECLRFFTSQKDTFPLINDLWHYDFDGKRLSRLIDSIVDAKGAIKDTASERLKGIRKNIIGEQNKVDRQIGLILKSMKSAGIVKDDCEITIRNGRSVIPMPAGEKRSVNGFIHDTSATGQTIYVEPNEIFDINNKVNELIAEEKQEIYKVLRAFTEDIRPDIPNIINMCNYLAYIDFLKSKAMYAISTDSVKPILTDIPQVGWKNAKHPILLASLKGTDRKIVPLNISLNEENRILVISGPNAGGKSIALKTVALLQYMLQCGLLVPASENSEAGIFSDIFIDIGDEQSIENDLSTYTSHLKNLKYFIDYSGDSSLILIDEFGSGTEPQLGSAIAEVTLLKFCELKAKGVITTHYGNIKKLAQETEGLQNGAMLFDTKNIKPLFELSVGNPGSSYTFEIARRVNFPEYILDAAATLHDSSKQIDYENQIQELILQTKTLEKERDELKTADNFLHEVIDKYTKQIKILETTKDGILQNAKDEAERIIKSANSKIETAIREIRECEAEKEKTKQIRNSLNEELNKVQSSSKDKSAEVKIKKVEEPVKIPKKIREQLEHKTELTKPKEKVSPQIKKIETMFEAADKNRKYNRLKEDFPIKPSDTDGAIDEAPLKVGDRVKSIDSAEIGEIIDISGKRATVNFGSINFQIELKRLRRCTEKEKPRIKNTMENVSDLVKELNERAYNFNLSIDVRGQRAEEALANIQKYVDDAVMLNIPSFTIIHGRGNGILRKIIRNYLHSVKEVESISDEAIERGGDGVSIVSLRNKL